MTCHPRAFQGVGRMKDKAESGGGNSPPIMADGRKRKRLDTELIHDSEGGSQLFASSFLFLLTWSPTCFLTSLFAYVVAYLLASMFMGLR